MERILHTPLAPAHACSHPLAVWQEILGTPATAEVLTDDEVAELQEELHELGAKLSTASLNAGGEGGGWAGLRGFRA